MAGGNNKRFKNDPEGFLNDHFIMVEPTTVGSKALPLAFGRMEIDLVPGPMQGWIRLENYAYQRHRHGYGAEPVNAFYLPVYKNESRTGVLTGECNFMFTADLSGCLFVASFQPDGTVQVEHLNAHDGTILDRVLEIGQAQPGHNPLMKILAPRRFPEAAHLNITVYTEGCVVGVRKSDGKWRFYYKAMPDSIHAEL